MSKIENIRKHYVPRIKEKQKNFDILDWASEETQFTRFGVLAANVELEGRTLLDVGCGLGDLVKFLDGRGISPAEYVGVDIIPEMLEKAREMNPGRKFVEADVFSPDTQQTLETLGYAEGFDVVFCSGTLNLNLGNNMEFLDRAISAMVGLTRGKLVFNCLHSRFPFADEKYFSYFPEDVLKITHKYVSAKKTILLDEYLAGDFTVICDLT